MKNKKLILIAGLLSLSLVATAIPTGISLSKANNAGSPRTLTTDITPNKPGRGETVSFLPEAVSQFWMMNNLLENYESRASDIGELTPYNDELASWTSHMGSSESEKDIRRNLFKKYDAFPPTNNILSWDSKIDAKNYKVIISQDKTFNTIEREYQVSGSEDSIIFDNPYSGTEYYWQVIATKQDDSLVYSDIFNFTSANLPRTVLIEGVSNTRDIGGNVGLNNKKVKEGLVYRGMGLEAITTNGENEFKNQLGIKTEVDLRGIGEGTENYLNLSSYYHYPSPLDYFSNSGDSMGIETEGTNSLVPSFGNAVKVFADKNNYPIYFHCAVGRDRTGWMGLCLDFLCGVSEEVALKQFILSLFATSGAYLKGNKDFYHRYLRIRDYINTFSGNNLSEKMENYLVTKTSVTHEDCENIRKILLGDIDTGFVPGSVNPDPYTDLARVTFRRFGQSPIIKMVEVGSLLDEPNITGNGAWYHGDTLWNFATDRVQEDMYLDYISKDKCKVAVHYTGIDIPDDVIEVLYHTELDFSLFDREGYTFKVYDDSFNRLTSCLVTDDISINVVYSPISGYIPKANSRIIVLAGQSNAAGVGHFQYLENSLEQAKIDEITHGYDNVLMSGYSHGHYYNEFFPVYADINYRSTDLPGTFGFEVGLADRFSKVFPDETTYIVKHAFGGASLNYDWVSPSGMDAEICVPYTPSNERGWLYTGLVQSMNNAIRMISESTNTIPMVEAFMWMQGETDATEKLATDLYLQTFNSLLDDFVTTFKDNISYKFACYDGAIAEGTIWQYAKQMNGIKRSRVNDKNIYIETNDRLSTLFEPMGATTDNAHYDAACYIDLGHMFADAYLTKTLRGYTYDKLEIEAIEPITMTLGQDYVLTTPKVFLNDEEVSGAKLSYFAEQHHAFDDSAYTLFKVNDDNTFTPLMEGETVLRITAYYQGEVRTIFIPVEIVE